MDKIVYRMVRLKLETVKALMLLVKIKGETYDDIIKRLLNGKKGE